MLDICFGRIRDLNGLPGLVDRYAGAEALERLFSRHHLPLELMLLPETVIPTSELITLYKSAANVCGLRSVGLEVARCVEVGRCGPFGRYIMQASNLRRALARCRRVLSLYERGGTLVLEETGDESVVGYEHIYQTTTGFRHFGDIRLRVLQGIVRGFAGEQWRPRRVEICYGRGKYEQDYEDVFSAPVAVRTNRIALVLEREFVDQAKNAAISPDGKKLSLADLQILGRGLPSNFLQVVSNMVERNLPYRAVSLDNVSGVLNLEPRTFQRRLEKYDITFRQLVKQCRMRRAREFLLRTEESVERIGQSLGYLNTAHFTRAFKTEHGVTPTEFRMRRALEAGAR